MSTLDRYLGEREEQSSREERELQVEVSPALEELVKTYERWLIAISDVTIAVDAYVPARDTLSGKTYTPDEVQSFSLLLKGYEGKRNFRLSGTFLSALINEGEYEDYTLVTEHLETPIDYMGYYLNKNLTIIGNVGDYAGRKMSDGNLIINGCSGDFAGDSMLGGDILIEEGTGYYAGGHMRGGDILVRGNADWGAGESMSGGTLTIEGDVGKMAGSYMENGTIIVKGNAGRLAGIQMTGGILRVEGEIGLVSITYRGGEIWEQDRLVRASPIRKALYKIRGGRS